MVFASLLSAAKELIYANTNVFSTNVCLTNEDIDNKNGGNVDVGNDEMDQYPCLKQFVQESRIHSLHANPPTTDLTDELNAQSFEPPAQPVGLSAQSFEPPAQPVGLSAQSFEPPAQPVGLSAQSFEPPAQPVVKPLPLLGQSMPSRSGPALPMPHRSGADLPRTSLCYIEPCLPVEDTESIISIRKDDSPPPQQPSKMNMDHILNHQYSHPRHKALTDVQRQKHYKWSKNFPKRRQLCVKIKHPEKSNAAKARHRYNKKFVPVQRAAQATHANRI